MSSLPFLEAIEGYVKNSKKQYGTEIEPLPIFIGGLVVLFILLAIFTGPLLSALSLALFLSPLWLPVLVVWSAWYLWLVLKRSEFIAAQNYILLEIKPPRNIDKTPLAMEAVLSGIHLGPGEGTWYKKYIVGAVRPWWSLEIASIEGQIHFFIWTRATFRRTIEAQIYAQYPGAQVVEVDDYSKLISATHEEWEIFGCDFAHTRPDPYPIKTYVDYGLDKTQKENEQVDPLANLIEFMGSLGKGENLWLQMIVRVHKGEKYDKLNEEGKPFTWADIAKKEVESIRLKARQPSTYTDPITGKKVLSEGFPNPTRGQQETIAAIERNIAKLPFDVGIRGIYIADKAHFNGGTVSSLIGIFKQFSSESHNGFRPTRWLTEFDDYPWEFNVEERKNKKRRQVVEAYRRRQYFFSPYAFKDYMVMSTEEIATIFHIPSKAVETPTLPRIMSTTSEAPSNLPT